MLNARKKETTTVFYSYLTCFVNTSHLEYVRIHVIYRVNQAEYVIHILVVAPNEYVKAIQHVGPQQEGAQSRIPYHRYPIHGSVRTAPSSVVKCLWEVFVGVWGVVIALCVCIGVGGVVLCRCVCVCDLLIFFYTAPNNGD